MLFLIAQAATPAPDMEVAKWLTTLGIGGALAAFMFLLYRRDIKQYTDLWKTTTEQLIKIVVENTKSNTELTQLIETKMNGGSDEIKILKDTIKGQNEKIDRLEGQLRHLGRGSARS
jgi:hypothetical protein